jgi:hypothetical protein
MPLPDPDEETHERLLTDHEAAPAILSAVVAYLVGTLGRPEAGRILREWADEIRDHRN